ncbi:MAG TPA: hypothetical protein VMS89_07590 [Methanoregulaceae archaeon]|nr:hypothetical protein [Methanoregulaceae archaeon]
MMSIEEFLIICFGLIIVLQCFFMYIMSRRIQQLLNEQSRIGGDIEISDSELEALTKNVEEFKKHNI